MYLSRREDRMAQGLNVDCYAITHDVMVYFGCKVKGSKNLLTESQNAKSAKTISHATSKMLNWNLLHLQDFLDIGMAISCL